MIQRYLSLPSLKAGVRAVWIFVFGVIVLMMLCSYNGLLMYATYKNCDPLTTKLAKHKGKVLMQKFFERKLIFIGKLF